MDAMTEIPEKTEKNAPAPADFGEGLADFLQRNRRTLGILAAALLIAALSSVAVFAIREALQEWALQGLEELNRRYEALGGDLKTREAELAELLEDLAKFAARHSGYAGALAHSIMAEIHGGREDWSSAEESWKAAARAGERTYLEPAALFNAAAAAEHGGRPGKALDLYLESVSHAERFPGAPRAQFSVGRLREAQGDTGGALEAYRELLDRWPLDPVWPNLAQSRIIALEIPAAPAGAR
jgi:tetratricopeptide (TPR) repeat protein